MSRHGGRRESPASTADRCAPTIPALIHPISTTSARDQTSRINTFPDPAIRLHLLSCLRTRSDRRKNSNVASQSLGPGPGHGFSTQMGTTCAFSSCETGTRHSSGEDAKSRQPSQGMLTGSANDLVAGIASTVFGSLFVALSMGSVAFSSPHTPQNSTFIFADSFRRGGKSGI